MNNIAQNICETKPTTKPHFFQSSGRPTIKTADIPKVSVII